VLESCRAAARQHLADLHTLGALPSGQVDLVALPGLLSERTRLVAVMVANNETGVVQPVADVVQVVRLHCERAWVLADAVQAAPFLDLAQSAAGADLVAVSAHKLGGPVGVGALAVGPRVTLAPHLHGGGQERERRSGTQDVAGAVGLATALRLSAAERQDAGERVARRRDRLAAGLVSGIPGAWRTVPPDVATLPGHLHLCLPGVEREEVLVALGALGVCASGGSSCASGALQSSHVLAAMGVADDLAQGAVRFTLGHGTTDSEVDRALAVVPAVVAGLRRPT
jgi:cysteine desulfurase